MLVMEACHVTIISCHGATCHDCGGHLHIGTRCSPRRLGALTPAVVNTASVQCHEGGSPSHALRTSKRACRSDECSPYMSKPPTRVGANPTPPPGTRTTVTRARAPGFADGKHRRQCSDIERVQAPEHFFVTRLGEAPQQRFGEAAGAQRVLHEATRKRRPQRPTHIDGDHAVKATAGERLTSSRPTVMCSGSPQSDG